MTDLPSGTFLRTGAAVLPFADAAKIPEVPRRVNPWFFMCGPLSLNVYLLGLAWNLHIFKRYKLDIDRVLDIQHDEIPTPSGLGRFAFMMLGIQSFLFLGEVARRGKAFGTSEQHMEMLLLAYCFIVFLLFICPLDIFHRKFRFFLLRHIVRCLWPFTSWMIPLHATPFIEVFIADGLTSLSKFIQDSTVAWMLFVFSWTTSSVELDGLYRSKLKNYLLPYMAASIPYIIRGTQCLISFYRTTTPNDRFLHLLNTLKYSSSLLVIMTGAYPQMMNDAGMITKLESNSFFMFCAVFNSLYSFLWDIIMDWGLGQPHLPSRVRFLRHQLLFRPYRVYYITIAIDFGLRVLWVTKWWDWDHIGVNFKMLSMVAEVLRRCMWNCLRVEWQCIKLEVLGSKKLSEDSMELEQSLELMPLMEEEEDEKEKTRTFSKDSTKHSDDESIATSPTCSSSSSPGRKLLHVSKSFDNLPHPCIPPYHMHDQQLIFNKIV